MKPLLILGSAPCLREDLAAALVLVEDPDFMIIGPKPYTMLGGAVKPQYMACYHPKFIPEMKSEMGADVVAISHQNRPGVDMVVEYKRPSGSSALLGVQAALLLGYDRIILCGCPLSDRRYNRQYSPGWKVAFDDVVGRVKSMSGWTAELLGEPDQNFIGEENKDEKDDTCSTAVSDDGHDIFCGGDCNW
jgi:hypothetical protein